MDKYVGKRLDGRYEIQEIIGVGGMAVVYKAHDNVENRTVAIKILKDEFITNEEFIRRFKNESKAIAVLSHQNIVKVYDVSFGDLIQYIVMEYIDGITLKEFISQQGSLRWKDAVYFTVQILKALQHAHDKGIVHRDVKPQNIMVLSDGTIKVADFGIARFARNEQRTITDKAIGSVHYISPEQARGEKTDEKADIYSVGVILYEMLTGKLPFDAESAVSVAIMQLQRDPKLPTEVNPAIPLGLEQITMHAMQKTQERRYQSASEFLCDLEQFKKDPESTFDYSYFVDNSPTKFMDTIMSSTPASAVTPEPVEEVEEEVKEKNNMIPILAGIASALVVAIIALGIIFIPKLFKDTGDIIVCPDFVGMTLDEAQTEHKEFLDNVIVNWEYISDKEYDKNVICGQSEVKDKKLKKNAKITLYISKGVNLVTIPNVYGETETFAISALEEKFNPTVKYIVVDDEEEAGLVISTDPKCGTKQLEGTEIIIFVGEIKGAKKVNVPKVVSLKQEDAVNELKKAGFTVKIEERDLDSKEKFTKKGYVVAQTPGADEKINEGSEIIIYVSSGKVNYTFAPMVSFKEFEFTQYANQGYVSLWKDGKKIQQSPKLDFTKKTEYTFDKLTTKDKKEETYTVYVSFGEDKNDYRFIEITVDTTTGKIKSDKTKTYNDYTAYVPNVESNTNSDQTSSGDTSSGDTSSDDTSSTNSSDSSMTN